MVLLLARVGVLALGLALLSSLGIWRAGFDPEEIWHFQALTSLAGQSIVAASIALIIALYASRSFPLIAAAFLVALSLLNAVIGFEHNGTHQHAMRRNAGLSLPELIRNAGIVHSSTTLGNSLAPDLDIQQIMVFEDDQSEAIGASLAVTLAGYLEAGIASWSSGAVDKVAFPDRAGGYRTVQLAPGLKARIDPALDRARRRENLDLCLILRAQSLVLTARGCPPSEAVGGRGS
jgi:hypothetical protein